MRNLYWLIAAFALAVTVHISSVLFAPGFLFDGHGGRLKMNASNMFHSHLVQPGSANLALIAFSPARV